VAAALAGYVPIYFDVLSDTKLSQELGIFRVPNIAVYTPGGERKGVVQGRFEKQDLLNLLTK
jgi:thiol:disulfide interchange protein